MGVGEDVPRGRHRDEAGGLSGASLHIGGALAFGPAVGRLCPSAERPEPDVGRGQDPVLRPRRDDPAREPPGRIHHGVYEAIWAYGLRDPFTIAFQPGTLGLPPGRRGLGHRVRLARIESGMTQGITNLLVGGDGALYVFVESRVDRSAR